MSFFQSPIELKFDEPAIDEIMYQWPLHLINLFDRFDDKEGSLGLDTTISNGAARPAVLIFLPGIHEIQLMHKQLNENWDRMYLNNINFIC